MRWRRKEDEMPARVPRPVSIREESIRLGQFLKLADLIDNGADAKPLVQSGQVLVNGEVETRRGRQLAQGDVVTLGEEQCVVAAFGDAGDGLPW
jgi:ribosome-associated protein